MSDLVVAVRELAAAVEEVNRVSFAPCAVRQYGMRSATPLEVEAVRSDSGAKQHPAGRLIATIDPSAAAAAAAAATAAAAASEADAVGGAGETGGQAGNSEQAPLPSPTSLKRTFQESFGTMERIAAAYHLPPSEEETVRNLRARHASVESALRTLKRRLGDQEAEAEAHAAEVHGQPATLVTRDALAAAVASKQAALAAAKRKCETLQQERDTLRAEVAAARSGDGAAAAAAVVAAEEESQEAGTTEEQRTLAGAVEAERQHLEDLRAVLCARAMAAGGGDEGVGAVAAEAVEDDEEQGKGEGAAAEGVDESESAAAKELAELRATMLALQERKDALCTEDEEARNACDEIAAHSSAAAAAEGTARATQADIATLRRYVIGAVASFAPSNDHAAALQLLADADGEMALDDLKSGTSIKTIYEMVANALIKIDRTQVPNVVLSLVG